MQRRRFLALAGVGTGLAGCSSSSNTPAGTPTKTSALTESPSPTETPTPSPVPPTFELVDLSVPKSVELREPLRVTFTVRNTGGAGTFETAIQRSVGDNPPSTVDTWSVELENGEEATYESEPFRHDIVANFGIRIAAFDETQSYRSTPAVQRYGVAWRTAGDVVIQMERTSVEYDLVAETDDGNRYRIEPEQQSKFIVAHMDVDNNTGDAAILPTRDQFALVTDESAYGPVEDTLVEGYTGGQVQAGEDAQGIIAFTVPRDLVREDYAIQYRAGGVLGVTVVNWVGSLDN